MIHIHSVNGYMSLLSWRWGNILQLATQGFCKRFIDHKADPCGRLRDQMEMAARTVPANIAEGSSRHQTSYETEMRLLDVARASASEQGATTSTGSCAMALRCGLPLTHTILRCATSNCRTHLRSPKTTWQK